MFGSALAWVSSFLQGPGAARADNPLATLTLQSDRCYVIGDVHGRPDLLSMMHAAIDADQDMLPEARSSEIYLGDLVDRGPDTRAVIDMLIERSQYKHLILVRGNHEEMMIDIYNGNNILNRWRMLGGGETLLSYGISKDRIFSTERYDLLLADITRQIPETHIKFIERSFDYCEWRNYVFTHAGVRSGIPLDRQSKSDLQTIREPFLTQGPGGSFIIVHGHTPKVEPDVRLDIHRIGIDTGAYYTGALTCLALDERELRVIQVKDNSEVETWTISHHP